MASGARQKLRREWETRIAEYQASGQSVREWCAANGIKPGRLWYHLRRCRERCQEKAGKETMAPMWLQATLTGPAPEEQDSARLLIRIGEATIEVRAGFDPELLSGVVRVLRAIC